MQREGVMTWPLTDESYRQLVLHTALILVDAEHCAIIVAGPSGDSSKELNRYIRGPVADRVADGLQADGCPTEHLAEAVTNVIATAMEYVQQRDAALVRPEGSA